MLQVFETASPYFFCYTEKYCLKSIKEYILQIIFLKNKTNKQKNPLVLIYTNTASLFSLEPPITHTGKRAEIVTPHWQIYKQERITSVKCRAELIEIYFAEIENSIKPPAIPDASFYTLFCVVTFEYNLTSSFCDFPSKKDHQSCTWEGRA